MEPPTNATGASVSTDGGEASSGWDFEPTATEEESAEDAAAASKPVNPPLPRHSSRAPERLSGFFYQDGQLNRRAVFIAVILGVLLAFFIAQRQAPHMTGRAGDTGGRTRQMPGSDTRAKPSVSRPLTSGTDSAMQRPLTSNTNSFGATEQPALSTAATPQPVFQPSVFASTEPAVVQAKESPQAPVAAVTTVIDAPTFSIRLKASKRASVAGLSGTTHTAAPDTNAVTKLRASGEPDQPKLARGTRIRLRLLEAMESGAPAPSRAVVVADVVDSTGTVIIPKGTEAEVPFSGGEYNGRVIGARNEPVLFLVEGQEEELNAEGTIKGLDGRAGIPGKVTTKGGPSVVGRVVGGAARAASRIVTGPLGGIGGYEAAEMAGVYAGGGSSSTRRTVEVPKGTEFIFVVGL